VMGLTFLAAGASSHGRHCHSTLPLAAVGCRCLFLPVTP
jgi:hypothetical protein